MECMTAVVFCVLLSTVYSMDSQNDDPCKSNTNDASTPGETVPLERREHFLKVQSAKSYVSFMIGDELICGGVLNSLDGAIAALACGQKLQDRGLGNVIAVIGLSPRDNTPPLHISEQRPLIKRPGLCLVLFQETIFETNFISESPSASLRSSRRIVTHDYLVTWSTAQNDYVIKDVLGSMKDGQFMQCFVPEEFAVPSPNEYDNYIMFRDGRILGCSFGIAYGNPLAQRSDEFTIRYAPIRPLQDISKG